LPAEAPAEAGSRFQVSGSGSGSRFRDPINSPTERGKGWVFQAQGSKLQAI